VHVTSRSALGGLAIKQLQFSRPAQDLVRCDLLVLLAAELLGVGRIQVLSVRGKRQEERVLGTRRTAERLELAIRGAERVGVDAAAFVGSERRDEDQWISRGRGACRNAQGKCPQGEGQSPVISSHRETPRCRWMRVDTSCGEVLQVVSPRSLVAHCSSSGFTRSLELE